MRTKIYITLLAFLVAACGGDDNATLESSYLDKDWLAITDSADPLDHARYEVYHDKGISIYYTDTLGKEFRYINAYGDSIIHFEKLDPFYSVTGVDASTTYILSKNRDDLYNGVLFVKENVLPILPTAFYPRNILLVNELTLNVFETEDRGRRFGNVYDGYRTLIISNVGRLDDMTPDERAMLAAEIAATVWYGHAQHLLLEMQEFFRVSEAQWISAPQRPSVYYTLISTGSADIYRPHWHAYGFLASSPNMPGQLRPNPSVPGEYSMYYTPSREEDAIAFFTTFFFYTSEAFDAMYAGVTGYNLLRQKFDIIRDIVELIKNTR
jgi:hypothetical protein